MSINDGSCKFFFQTFYLDFHTSLVWRVGDVWCGAGHGSRKGNSRRRENGETIWDAMIWVLPLGIIGARLWYVLNDIIGGGDQLYK